MNDRNMLKILLGGDSGGILITGTDAVTGSFDLIVVNEDAVFTDIIIEGEDVVTARGFAAKTVKAGMYIGAGRLSGQQYASFGAKITNIKLASGSVMAY